MTDVPEATILTAIEGSTGWLTFNNEKRRNAISFEMWLKIDECMRVYDSDDSITAVVITGAGEKAFASGADISQFEKSRSNPADMARYANASKAALESLKNIRKPVIAMIRGYCLGGGLAIALQADLRLASADAQFGIPAARLGLAYGLDNLQALSSLVGPSVAKDFLFTARRFSAQEALQIGLVNRVIDGADLDALVRDYARMIGENAPLTIRAAKFALNEIARDSGERDLQTIKALGERCMTSDDYAEGRRAFMEKRSPKFIGR